MIKKKKLTEEAILVTKKKLGMDGQMGRWRDSRTDGYKNGKTERYEHSSHSKANLTTQYVSLVKTV